MSTKETLVAAALEVLERDGQAQFSTRAVCAMADVSAPTLYHHFGSADGLLSAAITEAFAQFLAGKKAVELSRDPREALRQGWDNYVQFAADRPRLYAAMVAKVLSGSAIPAAEQARHLLVERIQAIASDGGLAMTVTAAADLIWASAHGAAVLHVTAPSSPPDPAVIEALRERALESICTSLTKGQET